MKGLYHGVILALNNIPIRKKLFFAFFLLITIPFGVFVIANYYSSIKDLEKKTTFSANQSFDQTVSFLEHKTSNISYISDIIFSSTYIIDFLKKKESDYDYPIPEELDEIDRLNTIFENLEKSIDINRIRLYINPWHLFANENKHYYNIEDIKNTVWYKKLENHKGKILWCPPDYFTDEKDDEERVVSAARNIWSSENYRVSVGVFRVDFSEKDITKILNNSMYTPSSFTFIINSQNEVVCSSDNFKKPDNDQFLAEILASINKTGRYETYMPVQINSLKVMMMMKDVKETDWKIINIIPYDDIIKLTKKSRDQAIVLIVCIILFAYPVSLLISHSMTKRILSLMKQMKRVENGDFNVAVLPHSNDEIGQLRKNFNYMLTRMAILMDEKQNLGKEIKNAELKALQAQINPHFLYNTLELINWMSMESDAPQISKMVQMLAKFYKLSLSRGEDIITIRDELDHVKVYVFIQNMRFKNCINFLVEGMEALYDYYIMKIILQPLVENSILHGIITKPGKSGTVAIRGEIKQNRMEITIEDDGIGMTQERIYEITSGKYESSGNGYGVRNTNERLKLNYGSSYGLKYDSTPGKGTRVTVIIPVLTGNYL